MTWLTGPGLIALGVRHARQLLRLYLKPRFGSTRLDQIKREDIKRFLSELSATGKLSRNGLRLIVCTLRGKGL
jgi:hypothetical protein